MNVAVLLVMSSSALRKTGNVNVPIVADVLKSSDAGLNDDSSSSSSGSSNGTGIIVQVDKVKFGACLRFRIRPDEQLIFLGLREPPIVQLDLTATIKTVAGISIPIKLTRLPGVKKVYPSDLK